MNTTQTELAPLIVVIPLVVGLVSALTAWSNLVSSKEQKISEFRHKWIGDVRDTFATFAARVLSLARIVKSLCEDDPTAFQKLATHEKIATERRELWEAYLRLRLHWQPKNPDYAALDHHLRGIMDVFGSPSQVDPTSVRIQVEHALELVTQVQKSAWMEVKRGERAYVRVVRLSLSVLFLCGAVAVMLLWHWFQRSASA